MVQEGVSSEVDTGVGTDYETNVGDTLGLGFLDQFLTDLRTGCLRYSVVIPKKIRQFKTPLYSVQFSIDYVRLRSRPRDP